VRKIWTTTGHLYYVPNRDFEVAPHVIEDLMADHVRAARRMGSRHETLRAVPGIPDVDLDTLLTDIASEEDSVEEDEDEDEDDYEDRVRAWLREEGVDEEEVEVLTAASPVEGRSATRRLRCHRLPITPDHPRSVSPPGVRLSRPGGLCL